MKAQNKEPEMKTSTAHLGSLYIPPPNQQQQRKIASPPTPPERNADSPGFMTPPLKEAPKPWQTKPQQEEIPPWAKRDNQQEEMVRYSIYSRICTLNIFGLLRSSSTDIDECYKQCLDYFSRNLGKTEYLI